MRCIQQIVVCNWPEGKSCKIENGWLGLLSSGINYLKVVMQNIASIKSIILVHFHGNVMEQRKVVVRKNVFMSPKRGLLISIKYVGVVDGMVHERKCKMCHFCVFLKKENNVRTRCTL